MQAKKHFSDGKLGNYIDDIGFVLISLFNGFIIVALIDLRAPPVLIPLIAVAGTIYGSKYIKSIKQKQAHL